MKMKISNKKMNLRMIYMLDTIWLWSTSCEQLWIEFANNGLDVLPGGKSENKTRKQY